MTRLKDAIDFTFALLREKPTTLSGFGITDATSDSELGAHAALTAGVHGLSVFNVAAYGATGDGITDDTAAIQDAWDALTGAGAGVLYFPTGNYLTTGLVFQSGANFTLKGERGANIWITGSTTLAPTQATHNVVTIADCTDFAIDGLVIDGRRDTIAPNVLLSSNAASGQKNVTVADASTFHVGEMVQLFGGLTINGGAEKDRNEAFQYITAITGNVLTLTDNFANAYTAGAGGAYVTRYQTGDSSRYTAAGRALGNEDAQNGLHLLTCSRFQIINCVAQNVWESPIKCGTGFQATTPTDGCSDGVVVDNTSQHGYDQGVSVWVSQYITVANNLCTDAGWGGVVFTHSNDCQASGNVCTNNYYEPPGDTNSGSGIAVEGGERIVISNNICTGNKSNGIRLNRSPIYLGFTTLTAGPAAGATTLSVVSASFMRIGSSHVLIDLNDQTKRENFTVSNIVGTTVTLARALRNSYANGSNIKPRYNQGVELVNNVCSQNVNNAGIAIQHGVAVSVTGNDCSDNGVGVDTFQTNGIYVANDAPGTVVANNQCTANAQEGIFVDACLGVSVQANKVTLSGISGAVKHGIKGLGLQNGAIVGNHLERNTGDGICLEDGTTGVTTRMTIAQNACVSNAHRGIFFDNGQPNGNTIANNTCEFNGEPGIHLGGGTSNVISGNVCANQNGQEGIRLDDWNGHACDKNIIIGNTLYDDRGGSAQQNYGLRELGSTGNSQIAYNRVYGNTSGQISKAASSTATGNIES